MTTEHHTNLVDGLRQLADFLDENPALADRGWVPKLFVWADTEAEFKANNALLGTFTKSSCGKYLNAERMFGPIVLQSTIAHENICEQKVTGTRKVTKYVPADPDYVAPELVEVEVEEDVTEWVCPPTWVQR